MEIIPVLDLLGGVVVRGVAGERDNYRPIKSRWTSSAAPLDVARALKDHFAFRRLYVADLDGILTRRPRVEILAKLAAEFPLLVDAGPREGDEAATLLASGAEQVIVGLETCQGPDSLAEIVAHFGPGRVVFSLDLKNGKPLGDLTPWRGESPEEIAAQAMEGGVQELVVLDLAAVGMGGGVPTLELCSRLRTSHPGCRLITGGGVAGLADLAAVEHAGANGVLIASALHDGRISPASLRGGSVSDGHSSLIHDNPVVQNMPPRSPDH